MRVQPRGECGDPGGEGFALGRGGALEVDLDARVAVAFAQRRELVDHVFPRGRFAQDLFLVGRVLAVQARHHGDLARARPAGDQRPVAAGDDAAATAVEVRGVHHPDLLVVGLEVEEALIGGSEQEGLHVAVRGRRVGGFHRQRRGRCADRPERVHGDDGDLVAGRGRELVERDFRRGTLADRDIVAEHAVADDVAADRRAGRPGERGGAMRDFGGVQTPGVEGGVWVVNTATSGAGALR